MGSPEVRGTVELEGGRRYELEVDYPADPGALVRGLVVGARPAPGGDHIERAAAAAAGAELAIVIVGTDDDWETEGEDRTSLALPGDQDELVAAVVAANPNTVVVAQHRLAGDDAVARRRAGRRCSCGSRARRSATPSPTC